MKSQPSVALAVLALGAAPLFATSSPAAPDEAANGRKIDIIAVAERFVPPKTPAAEPVSALVVDAGYVELGYPAHGEKPPPQKALAESFCGVLTDRGFQPATSASPASVVLVYRWGSVRPNPFYSGIYNVAGGPSNPKCDPTWKYRLFLVAPGPLASRAMERLVEGRTNPLPGAYEPAEVFDVIDHARYARYFAVVSAYDAASVARDRPALLWRTKLSAETTGGSAAEVLPALLAAAGPYLNRHASKPITATAAPASPAIAGALVPTTALPSDHSVLRTLLQYDHDTLFGPDSLALAENFHRSSSPNPVTIDALVRRADQIGSVASFRSSANRR